MAVNFLFSSLIVLWVFCVSSVNAETVAFMLADGLSAAARLADKIIILNIHFPHPLATPAASKSHLI